MVTYNKTIFVYIVKKLSALVVIQFNHKEHKASTKNTIYCILCEKLSAHRGKIELQSSRR